MSGSSPGPYGSLHLGRGSFGEAIRALKDGKMVARSGWNGKGMFVFMQVPASIGMNIVPNMQSLPQDVKDEFMRRAKQVDENNEPYVDSQYIKYQNQLAMVYPDNNVYGWLASPSDVLSNDWGIYEHFKTNKS